jgi:DNA invertase Pin-like site-specific DNA recombinase
MKHQVVGYIRVSSQGQNTARQLVGIEVDRKFTDIMTGSIKTRPQLEECLKYVRQGDTLVVDSIDRLARNLRNLQEIIDEMREKGVSVRFIKENLLFTSNSDGMSTLMLQMMGAFAEFERTMIRSRQREGIDLALSEGKKMGRPPVLNGKHKKQAKDLREQGMSIRKIAMTMDICRASVYKLLDLVQKP